MIEEFIKNLKNNEYFSDQIVHHEIISSKPAVYETPVPSLHYRLRNALKSCNVNQLYSHQSDAITRIREKKNVLISTPTASGKTLTYNVPILESILKDKKTHAFYIFPIKAQDKLFE